jgi:GntR family transcriptional repressor for pyruvate dehydrogenase complex
MLQLVEMRTVIELQSARMAALRATPDNLTELEKYLHIMEKSKNMDDDYFTADLGFHIALGRASQNSFLYTLVYAYTPLLRNVIITSSRLDSFPEQKSHYHRNIFDSVANGDADGAIENMRIHLNATENNIEKAKRTSFL